MSNNINSCFVDTPIGRLELQASAEALTAIHFTKQSDDKSYSSANKNSLLEDACKQVQEYFDGTRRQFNLSLQASGTAFEKEVWNNLRSMPWGVTITYKELAKRLGDVNKIRAVGRANGQNPLPVVIPCHRIIGADNKLVGYAGGIERKRWLLQHEGAILL